MSTFNTALSGMTAASTDMRVTGNNIANASTHGFKQSDSIFADIYQVSSLGVSGSTPGSGVRVADIKQDFSQGGLDFTSSPLDLAVSGSGFFIVEDVNTRTYTRAGNFGADRDGVIVNNTGQSLLAYQVDDNGASTGVLSSVTIDRSDSPPNATTDVTMSVNLNSAEVAPAEQWLGTSTFGGNLPSSDTYNQVTSMAIYDSVGFEHVLTAYFAKTDSPNIWEVNFQVDGQDIDNPTSRTNEVDSSSSTLATAGVMTTLDAGDLTINGTAVPDPSTLGLPASPWADADANASAFSIAAAINNGTGTHGVSASVNDVVVNLGTYVPDTMVAGQFTINGVDITPAGATETDLLNAINAPATQAATGGVVASTDSGGNILLTLPATAPDAGRNIVVSTDGTAATATFTNYTLSAASTQAQRGTYTLLSNSQMTIAGSAPGDVDLAANVYTAPWVMTFNNDGSLNAASSDNVELVWTPLDASGSPNGAVSPQTFTIDLDNSTQFGSSFSVQAATQDGFTSGRLSEIDVDEDGFLNARFSNGQSQVLAQVVLAFFENENGLDAKGDTLFGETYESGQPVIAGPGTSGLGKIQSGALESSNVNLTDELIRLIINQRDFQANAKSIETANAITQTIINIR